MGKPTGFLEYDRVNGKAAAPLERIKNFNEFHTPLTEAQQRKQGARCMECGVPFCQSGMMMNGMVSMAMAEDMLLMVNGHFFRGCGRLIHHFCHRPKLNLNPDKKKK